MPKKLLKKIAKAAPLLALGLGATALGKRKRHLGVRDSDDAGRGVNWFGHRMDKLPFADHTTVSPDFQAGYKKGGRVTGAAKRGFGRALMKGKK